MHCSAIVFGENVEEQLEPYKVNDYEDGEKWDYYNRCLFFWLKKHKRRKRSSALKGEIDFEYTKNRYREEASFIYDRAQKIITNMSWLSRQDTYKRGINYYDQPAVKSLMDKKAGKIRGILYVDIDDFLLGKTGFINKYIEDSYLPSSFIIDGDWYDMFDMRDKEKFYKLLRETLDSVSSETRLTYVDFHR